MATDENVRQLSVNTNGIKFAISIFAVVGIGLGFTGAFALIHYSGDAGGAFLSGILSIVILFIALLTGPIIGAIIGVRIGSMENISEGRKLSTSFFGNVIGYFVMVMIVVLILIVAIGIAFNGGGTDTTQDTVRTNQSGSVFSITDLIVPLIGFSIPTGLAGMGSTWVFSKFGRQAEHPPMNQDTPDSPATKSGSWIKEKITRIVGQLIEDIEEIPYRAGLIFGILSLVTVMILVSVISLFFLPSLDTFGLNYTPIGWAKYISWMVLIAHGVSVKGLFYNIDPTLIGFVFTWIPGVVSLSFGFITARIRKPSDYLNSFVNGASICIGYAILVLIPGFIAQIPGHEVYGAPNVSGSSASVNIVLLMLKAGILYPAVYGGLGGVIAFKLFNTRW